MRDHTEILVSECLWRRKLPINSSERDTHNYFTVPFYNRVNCMVLVALFESPPR